MTQPLMPQPVGIVQRPDGSIAFDWNVQWEVTHARNLAIRDLYEASYRAALAAEASPVTTGVPG